MPIVHYNPKTRPSGEVLAAALTVRRYHGPPIIWGKANNKREALVKLQEAKVTIPTLTFEWPDYPCVGRPDDHVGGHWMYRTPADAVKTRRRRAHPPTHFLRWIEVTREFRVHVVDGRAIRTQEKIPVGTFVEGISRWVHPAGFEHVERLHKLGCRAVKALEFDFGAVDILWDGTLRPSNIPSQRGVMVPNFFVIEVNSAPCLVRGNGTLSAYVEAFMRRSQ